MDETDEFVENAGVYYEGLGLSRTAGRILGWLLVCPPGDADAPELAERLGVAKSSISVALRQLATAGLILRFRPARARRDRYRLAEDVFARAFQAKMAEFIAFGDLVEQGLRVAGDQPDVRRRLELMRAMYAFMGERFPALLAEWEEHKQRLTAPPSHGET